jgi:hypothetical protein
MESARYHTCTFRLFSRARRLILRKNWGKTINPMNNPAATQLTARMPMDGLS